MSRVMRIHWMYPLPSEYGTYTEVKAMAFRHEPLKRFRLFPICSEADQGSSSSSLLLSRLELSDTQVYQPQIRARLGTAAHFCEVVGLKLRGVRTEDLDRAGHAERLEVLALCQDHLVAHLLPQKRQT